MKASKALLLWLVVLLAVSSAPVHAAAEPAQTMQAEELGREWIEKMSRAMQDTTYVGTFVYLHGSELETMKIYHSRIDGVEYERLISLNGEAREIIRDADSVVCIWPGSKSVIVNKSQPRTPFPQFEPAQLAALSEFYQFRKGRDERVAGRRTRVIDIVPQDNYRYGYRLWIDKETFLLIRSAMRDNAGRLVEQVMFTDISYPESVPLEMFNASISGKRHEWMVDDEPLKPIKPVINAEIPSVEQLALPGGFELVSEKITPVSGSMSGARRLMYTDGLASLSVFIVAAGDGSGEGVLKGGTSMGAVNAFGVLLGEWHATVVGEVPHAAVEMLARSLQISAH